MRMLTANAHDVPDKDGRRGDWFLFLKSVDRQESLRSSFVLHGRAKGIYEITLSLPMTPWAGIS